MGLPCWLSKSEGEGEGVNIEKFEDHLSAYQDKVGQCMTLKSGGLLETAAHLCYITI